MNRARRMSQRSSKNGATANSRALSVPVTRNSAEIFVRETTKELPDSSNAESAVLGNRIKFKILNVLNVFKFEIPVFKKMCTLFRLK